jgi:hypothetical protein
MLFNPSLEIQTTDNYIDWTSLSVVNLDNINWSSRSIPVGVDSEIDIATLTFNTPIFISPPVKVKKLGVIQNIITAMFSENGLEVNIDDTAYAQSLVKQSVLNENKAEVPDKLYGKREAMTSETTLVTTSHNNYDLIFMNDGAGGYYAQLLGKGVVGAETWTGYIKSIPQLFQPDITELRLQRSNGYEIVGTVSINPIDETKLSVNIDTDTLPDDTVINGTTGIDAIIDPVKGNPKLLPNTNPRILLLGNVGHIHTGEFTVSDRTILYDTKYPFNEVVSSKVFVNGTQVNATHFTVDSSDETYQIKFGEFLNKDDKVYYELYLDVDGPDAWKNADGTDFAASVNDIVEWDGSKWDVIFKAINTSTETFVTNFTTNKQYKWTGSEWILSFEGEYPDGTWRLAY